MSFNSLQDFNFLCCTSVARLNRAMSNTFHHGKRQKLKRFGDLWWWWRSEPKAWRKLYKHIPRRAEVRRCVHRVLRGDECVMWPLDTKPWVYYW